MARADARPRKACCLVSEVLEEAGLDRSKVRQLRKQVLEGIVMLCQWQLERMRETEADEPRPKRGRKVAVE